MTLGFFPEKVFGAAPPAAESAAEQDTTKVIDLFYDLQFDRAAALVHELEARYPGYPAAPFYLSVAYYQKYLLEDPPSAATFKQFEACSQTALELAVKIKSLSPAVSHYYQGAVLGFQARAYVTQGRYAMAIPKARQGVAHLTKALELDPSLVDAKLGLGMYYYFLSKVPPAAKPFAYLMVGMWGDREKGLMLLREVAEKGRVARSEAQSILAAIDASQRERKWDDAVRLLKPLMERYPHNPRYRIKLIYVLQREGFWDEAVKTADADGSWLKELDPLVKDRAALVVRYRTVESLLFSGRASEAAPILDRLESGPVWGKLKDWNALRRGNYWDALGKPELAKPFYLSITDKKAQGLAAIFLQTPFPAGPRDVMPNRWPISNVPAE